VLAVGATTWTTSVTATTPDWLSVRARSVAAGRFITQADLDADAHVVVLGATTVDELFATGTGVGQDVTIDGTPYTVVGELAVTGTTAGLDQDDLAVLPITTAEQSLSNGMAARSPRDLLGGHHPDPPPPTRRRTRHLTRHDVTADTIDFSIASQSLVRRPPRHPDPDRAARRRRGHLFARRRDRGHEHHAGLGLGAGS
jgi:putative ABC transport system permease protein